MVLCFQLCWEVGLWARHFSACELLQDLQIERATGNANWTGSFTAQPDLSVKRVHYASADL